MFKIRQFAVVIAATLWFASDTFAHENKHSSTLEESDFYFNDASLNESTSDSNPLKTETIEFDKNGERESIDKLHSEDADEYFSVGNLKRLIRYFVSLLHSIDENNSHDAQFLQDYKFRKKPISRKNKVKANRTNSTPRIFESSYTENTGDTEFKNSGEGNDGEYYEERNNFKNPYEVKPRIKTLKSNTKRKPRVRNHERISGGQQSNSNDNQKLTSENFGFNRHRGNHSALRNGQVSDEFIDEYINPPTEKVFMKSYEEPVSNQPTISSERGNQTVELLKESPREEIVSDVADRTLINPQSLNDDNIPIDMKTTFHKEVVKEDFLINEDNDTNHKTFSNQNRDMENKNAREIAVIKSRQNHFPSNESPHFISNKPQNNKNGTSTSLSEEFTSIIPKENFSSPEESELSRSQQPKISSVRKYIYDRTLRNFSTLNDSRNIKSLMGNIQSPEPQTELKSTASYKAENESLRQPLNNSKSFIVLRDFNETNRLRSQNSQRIKNDRESKTDRRDPNERYFVKHPKLEEKRTREFFYASEGLKSRTDSNTNTDSSDSNINNWTKLQPGNVSNKAEGEYSQQSLNSTKTFTVPRDFNKTNRLLPTKSSTDTESEADTDEPNEKHLVEHPIEEKETRKFSVSYQESNVQTDSDTDSDSSDYSDSGADHRTQMQSGNASYKTKSVSSQQPVNGAQSFTVQIESNKTNRLLPQNSSTDAEPKNDMDILSEQHSDKHPKLEEKENRDFGNASQESKVQTDSDTDSDSSYYSDSEELYEYFEYDDEDIPLISNLESYFTGNSSNTSTTSSEIFTAPFTNYSMGIELPTRPRNDSKINTPHKTQGLYNSILEFLYKYSNSTWIKKLKEENRRM